jgi:hypothetical protein
MSLRVYAQGIRIDNQPNTVVRPPERGKQILCPARIGLLQVRRAGEVSSPMVGKDGPRFIRV